MRKEKKQNKPALKSWLLTKPLMFTLWCMGLIVIFGLSYALIQTFFNFESLWLVYTLCALTFALPICYMIQKLPHEKMNQSDFVAIANGATIISVIPSFIAVLMAGFYSYSLQRDMMALYMWHPAAFSILLALAVFISIYLIGVSISGIYAKYKRATTLGVSPWKVILSMPFAFLLMWTPGYLIKDKDTKSGLEIKSAWYAKFNKWVLSNFSNTLFVFLFLLFCKGLMTGVTTLILSALLLAVYALWFTKHKSDFVKNINDGYAITAIGINLAILIAIIIQLS